MGALLLGGLATVVSAAAEPSRALQRKLAAPASARWSGAPLAPSLQRMAEAFGVSLWIDRRVDPEAALTLAIRDARFADVIDRVAQQHRLAAAATDRVIYLGTPRMAARFGDLIEAGRAQRSPAMKRRGVTAWPRLATPRGVAVGLAESVGVEIANPETIPHDLWPAGETASLPATDRLTLLLIGFDLRWRVDPRDAKRLVIERIETHREVKDAPTLASQLKKRSEPTGPTRQEYTLRLVGQPLDAVLKQLAKQVGREVRLDPSVNNASRGVRAAVAGVSLEELLEAIGDAAGVAIEDDGETWRVTPLDKADAS
ncbi:hypothetical protein MalM25_09130 [Planctomycetes bacterium MalM25]|nr:hypothetical protein MalM25_09130 [Planctomycetes bacterium MalM25]